MVMNVMGHTDVRTAMRYQHPVLDSVRKPSIREIYVTTTSQRTADTARMAVSD